MSSARLELYVCGTTASSRAATEHAERLRVERLGGQVELVVFDTRRSPLAAREAGVLLAPTLILRGDAGERRCFGDFSDLDATGAALGLERAPA